MACVKNAREAFEVGMKMGGHGTNVMETLEILEAKPGWVKTKLTLKEKHLNGNGHTHGGCVMTLLDEVAWLALTTLGYPWSHTVSTNMSQEFVRPCGQLGDDLIIEGYAVNQGKRLAFTRVNFSVNGKQCGFGSHTMAMFPVEATHKFTPDGELMLPIGDPRLEEGAKAKL